MENTTDQKPNDESLQPAEVEGVEVAQAPAAEDETNQAEVQASGDQEASDKTDESTVSDAQASASEPVVPLQPVVHKSGAPVLAIVTAVIVAIGLAGITVYAYMQTQKDNKPATTQTATEDNGAAEAQEIDDTSKDIDKALEASEETDFPDSELTDQNLNL